MVGGRQAGRSTYPTPLPFRHSSDACSASPPTRPNGPAMPSFGTSRWSPDRQTRFSSHVARLCGGPGDEHTTETLHKNHSLEIHRATRQSLVVAEFRGRVIVGRKVWFSYISIGVGCDTLGACMSRLGVGVNYFAGGCHIAPRTQGQSDVKG